MQPILPAEMIGGAVELMVYFVTMFGVVMGLMLTGRG
jgi:hypothetical protein